MGLYPRGWEQVMVELPLQAVVHQHQLSIYPCIGSSEYIINSLQICIFNKLSQNNLNKRKRKICAVDE